MRFSAQSMLITTVAVQLLCMYFQLVANLYAVQPLNYCWDSCLVLPYREPFRKVAAAKSAGKDQFEIEIPEQDKAMPLYVLPQ